MRGGPGYVFQLYYVTWYEFWLILLPGDRDSSTGSEPPPQEFDPRDWKVFRGYPSWVQGRGYGATWGARSGGGAGARGGWPNGTRERGRRGRGSQGGSVPALRGPGGPLTPLRPGALSSQPDSAAATAVPEPGSGHCRLRLRLRPPPRLRPARHAPSPRPSAAPGSGRPTPNLPSPGPPTRGCGPWPAPRAGRPPTARGGETRAVPASSEVAVGRHSPWARALGPSGRSGLQDRGLPTGSEWVVRAPRQRLWWRLSRSGVGEPRPQMGAAYPAGMVQRDPIPAWVKALCSTEHLVRAGASLPLPSLVVHPALLPAQGPL